MGRHGGSIVTDQTDTKRKHKKIHRRKSFRPDGMIWLNDSTKMNCPQSTYTLLLKVTLTLSYLCSVNELSSFVNVLSYIELYREKKHRTVILLREKLIQEIQAIACYLYMYQVFQPFCFRRNTSCILCFFFFFLLFFFFFFLGQILLKQFFSLRNWQLKCSNGTK